jgi:hypothetical protein
LILVQHGLGYSLKNANKAIVQLKTRNSLNLSRNHSRKISKVVSSCNTAKVLLLDIQLRTEPALVQVIKIVSKSLISSQLSSQKMLSHLRALVSLVYHQVQQKKPNSTNHLLAVF